MAKETGLIVVENEMVAGALVSKPKMEALIERVKNEVAGIVPNMKTVKGRKEIASVASKVARTKVQVDTFGKDMVKSIQDNRKLVVSELDLVKVGVRKELNEWEEERKRIEEVITVLIEKPNQFHVDTLAVQIKTSLDTMLPLDEIPEAHKDMRKRLSEAYDTCRATLDQMFDAAVKREEEAQELADLRKEKEDRKKKEEDDRLAKIKEDRIAQEKIDQEAADVLKKPEEIIDNPSESAVKTSTPAIAPSQGFGTETTVKPRVATPKVKADDSKPLTVEFLEALEDLTIIFENGELALNLLNSINNGVVRNVTLNKKRF